MGTAYHTAVSQGRLALETVGSKHLKSFLASVARDTRAYDKAFLAKTVD